eukprot:CAMPEP_0173111624 /NCGR_PEP_ID=MMETSP1102-20130122/45326_1 /TAXON_ID=49646 /ORGANISM="Geminigera sp., Strain Caron Lab Isolate" /LENGTH=44 /DNA_ID= /DNA_START= /DNA_END= /DNA_ORIENTATION=
MSTEPIKWVRMDHRGLKCAKISLGLPPEGLCGEYLRCRAFGDVM